MKALLALLAALSVPFMLINMFGGFVAGIWLAILGEWKAIGMGILLLVTAPWILGILLMPSLIFAAPAAKALESGNRGVAIVCGSISVIWTMTLVVGWAFFILRYFYRPTEGSTIIPMLLWSYGAATGPWAYMAQKDAQAQGGNIYSGLAVFFLSVGYIVTVLAIWFWGIPLKTCLWILIASMSMATLTGFVATIAESRSWRD